MELFFRAVERGDEEEVSRRLDAEPVLLEKKQGFNGLKPVAVAAQARQLGVVKLLVQRGANVHARNGLWKQTALHRAAGEGHEKVVAFLLNNGARADTLDTSRSTPLQVAFRDGHIGVVKMLLQHMGAQGLVERSRMRWTALMEAAAGGQLDVAQIQPQHMGEQGLEETDENGKTILSWAVHGGNEETVALLLSQGAQATGRDKAGKTPLIWASSHGHLGVVRLLLQHTGGQGLDEADTTGLTALHWAAFKGHEELVVFLLSQGVQANSSDRCGKTPLLWASSRGHLSVVRVLLQHTGGQGLDDRGMAGCTALHSAAYAGREEVAAFLLSQGAQPNATDDQGSTPLIKAATNGRLSAAKVLLQHVGEEGRQARDHLGKTALHCAVYGKCEEMLRVLLLAGVDPSIRDARGRRPEEVARRGGPRGCVSVFEWWEGELERRYLLQRARSLHDASTTQRDTPTASVPAFLQARVAAGHVLPQVEVVAGEQEEHAGADGKRKASEEAGSTQEEEEQHAVVVGVVTQLNEQLFTELMQGFHAPR